MCTKNRRNPVATQQNSTHFGEGPSKKKQYSTMLVLCFMSVTSFSSCKTLLSGLLFQVSIFNLLLTIRISNIIIFDKEFLVIRVQDIYQRPTQNFDYRKRLYYYIERLLFVYVPLFINKLINSIVDNHHEIKILYRKFDKNYYFFCSAKKALFQLNI